jgi:F-type H+-transporting ATPase subunit epsilon
LSGETFSLEVATPRQRFSREVVSLRLRDTTGFFGVLRGHGPFLAVLVPSLGYYRDSRGNERFLAVDGGIFHVREGKAVLTSREVFEGDDPRSLAEIIEAAHTRRDAAEAAFAKTIEGIERAFLEKASAFSRENP